MQAVMKHLILLSLICACGFLSACSASHQRAFSEDSSVLQGSQQERVDAREILKALEKAEDTLKRGLVADRSSFN